MRKPLLVIAALIVTIASCQKPSSNNGPFYCTCTYSYQRGFFFVRDTQVTYNYAPGSSFTDAQLYCTNSQSSMKADTSKQSVSCYVH